MLLALEDDAVLGLVLGAADRLVEEGLVVHDPARLDAARGRQHDLGGGVVDASGELLRGEAAEDDGVDRADARTGEHRDDRLGHHRHVDDDAVALADAQPAQATGHGAHPSQQGGIRQRGLGARHGRVVVDGGLLTAPGVDVPVDGVVADVELGIGIPPVERRARVVEDAFGRGHPVDAASGFAPERLRVAQARVVDALVCR